MPRNRVIYQSEALYAGPSPAISGHYKFVTGNNAPNVPTQKLNQLDPLATRTLVSGSTTATSSLAVMQSGLLPNLANLNFKYNKLIAIDSRPFRCSNGNLVKIDVSSNSFGTKSLQKLNSLEKFSKKQEKNKQF